MSNLSDVQDIVAEHMDEILKLFKPGKKITVLVRTPDDPEGRYDFMMGDDDPQELLNMLARCKARGPNQETA